tara:strand:+ start:167 stop:511 length:345 start_codon:yes stop_codon:yes gene_type:complete
MPKNVPGFELLPGLHKAMKPKKNSLDGWWDRPFSDPEANLAKLQKKKTYYNIPVNPNEAWNLDGTAKFGKWIALKGTPRRKNLFKTFNIKVAKGKTKKKKRKRKRKRKTHKGKR